VRKSGGRGASSVFADDAPLPPDFLSQKKSAPKADDAPLPPDFLTQKKPEIGRKRGILDRGFRYVGRSRSISSGVTSPAGRILPPDFLSQKKSAPKADDAPLPPDFLTQKKPAPKISE
jgi:nucleoporin NUP159